MTTTDSETFDIQSFLAASKIERNSDYSCNLESIGDLASYLFIQSLKQYTPKEVGFSTINDTLSNPITSPNTEDESLTDGSPIYAHSCEDLPLSFDKVLPLTMASPTTRLGFVNIS